jgi:hypothetical protein
MHTRAFFCISEASALVAQKISREQKSQLVQRSRGRST